MCRSPSGPHIVHSPEAGFTLLEILLVVTLIVIVTAMIAPSFISMTGASIDDEVRRLQQVLRLAAEESQLTGVPVRMVVLKNGYRFEQLVDQPPAPGSDVAEQAWMDIGEPPFMQHQFDAGIEVGEIRFSASIPPDTEPEPAKEGEEQPIGRLNFWPDGMLDAVDLVLTAPEADEQRILQLRSGPGGIRLADEGGS